MEDNDLIGQAIGKYIKKRRNELGLTQEQVAERANMSHKHLGKLERGNRYPSGIMLFKILVALETRDSSISMIIKEFELLKQNSRDE
ncbi:helix-turn-helix domain-containing protein [Bacillus sp. DJP31]|uniref:helix-turn-helix domain-containing protein n=1 Tax=Bacillus sp. DJP31 TaxID=3409789 RepID=UPI003BB63599